MGKNRIELKNRVILVTGAAGFIGSFLARRLLETAEGVTVVGVDNLNTYYDPELKRMRLSMIAEASNGENWQFEEADISDREMLEAILTRTAPSVVVHLAAQAGVRYSIDHPDEYIQSNLIGFYNILEGVRHHPVDHLVYASSSSIYGGNTSVPFRETDVVDHPVSLYAATKKCDELLAYSYAKLYDIPSTGLRFFTVYGPAGRPDMAYFSFAEKLRAGKDIEIFNYGECQRDFTYIGDVVEGILRVMQGAPERSTGADGLPVPPYAIYNIGNSHPEQLMTFVRTLAEELIRAGVLPREFDIGSHMKLVPMQPGDVPVTYADTHRLEEDYGYHPDTPLREGLRRFAAWYAANLAGARTEEQLL